MRQKQQGGWPGTGAQTEPVVGQLHSHGSRVLALALALALQEVQKATRRVDVLQRCVDDVDVGVVDFEEF
jgi:hypothetical protein